MYITIIIFIARGRTLEDTLGDKNVEKLSLKVSEDSYNSLTEPSVLVAKEVGNMYTASLYGGLASLLARWVWLHSYQNNSDV